MTILTIKDFLDLKIFNNILKSKTRIEKISNVKFFIDFENNKVFFNIKDIFKSADYTDKYFYKLYYLIDRTQFDFQKIENELYTDLKTFYCWFGIKANTSEKIINLKKIINCFGCFCEKNKKDIIKQSKQTYSLEDF